MLLPGPGSEYDSDWEYEYDQNETESLYFTLELPENAEPARKRRKYNTKKMREAAAQEVVDSLAGEGRFTSVEQPSRGELGLGNEPSTGQPSTTQQPASSVMKFEDLHTANPGVEYDGARYHCNWSSDLGTQLIVSRPGSTKQPLRRGYAVDIVALSRSRLTGEVVGPAKAVVAKHGDGISADNAIVLDDGDENGESSRPPRSTPRTVGSGPSFLQRLANIKACKDGLHGSTTNGTSESVALESQTHAGASQGVDVAAESVGHQGVSALGSDSAVQQSFSSTGSSAQRSKPTNIPPETSLLPQGPAAAHEGNMDAAATPALGALPSGTV